MNRLLLVTLLCIASLCILYTESKWNSPKKSFSIFSDTTKRKNLSEAGTCIERIKVTDVFRIGDGSTEVAEIKNGFFYIHKRGVLDVKTSRLYDIKNAADRFDLYLLIGDSIMCLRTSSEQLILNLRTGFQYQRQRWKSKVFNLPVLQTFNSPVVPVFANDSTLLVTDLKSMNIVKRVHSGGAFSSTTYTHGSLYFAANDALQIVGLAINAPVTTIPLAGGLASNLLVEGNLLIYFDKGSAIRAYDIEQRTQVWEYALKAKSTIAIANDESQVYFTDASIIALDLKTGKLRWKDSAGESTVNNRNIGLVNKLLLSSYYLDDNAVIAVVDAKSGGILCNGFDMPEEKGFNRYLFYSFNQEGTLYAKDGGGLEKKIVKFELAVK